MKYIKTAIIFITALMFVHSNVYSGGKPWTNVPTMKDIIRAIGKDSPWFGTFQHSITFATFAGLGIYHATKGIQKLYPLAEDWDATWCKFEKRENINYRTFPRKIIKSVLAFIEIACGSTVGIICGLKVLNGILEFNYTGRAPDFFSFDSKDHSGDFSPYID